MKLRLTLIILIISVPSLAPAQWNPTLRQQSDQQTQGNQPAKTEGYDTAEPSPAQPAPQPVPQTPPPDEVEEEETPVFAPMTPPLPAPREDSFEEPLPPPPVTKEAETTAGPKKITIDAVVYVDYQFFSSPDAFKVKYHVNMGGTANTATSMIKGNAEIATEVTGSLAKWPGGQCLLNVNIAKIPYEIAYRQSTNSDASLSIQFKKDISERWESTCTFIGGVTKPFKTEGPPEKWIGAALEKALPSLSSISASIEAGGATSSKFDIPEYTVVEEHLGNAKVKGTGIVTIQPTTPEQKGPPTVKPTDAEEETSSFNPPGHTPNININLAKRPH